MKKKTLSMSIVAQHSSSSNTAWFALDSCVRREQEVSEVFVGGYLVGTFTPRDKATRNLLLVGLSQERRFTKVALANAFDVTDERLLQLRNKAELEGPTAVTAPDKRGRPHKANDAQRAKILALFEQGLGPSKAHELCGKKADLSYWTVLRMHQKWEATAGKAKPETASVIESLVITTAQQELALPAASETAASTQSGPEVTAETAVVSEAEVIAETSVVSDTDVTAETAVVVEPAECDEPSNGNALPTAPVVAARNVLHAGCLLLIAAVHALGLHDAVIKSWNESADWRSRLRVALDAIIAALGIGQKCVEGVRRLEHPSARALLRATRAPSESWVRRILKQFLDDAGSIEAHLGMTRSYLERARSEAEVPAVFYIDNHMRPYTGKRKLQKGWRMQDKRVRPGTTDYYVHDEDGRPLFRVDVPMHGTLGDWLRPITALLRETLGPDQRILLAFDRGGAFAAHLGALKQRGFEFVTYERGPYDKLAPEAFGETLELTGETLFAHEETVALGDTNFEVRRIALRTADERQVNVLAVSAESMTRLVEIITGRWVQESAPQAHRKGGSDDELTDCVQAA